MDPSDDHAEQPNGPAPDIHLDESIFDDPVQLEEQLPPLEGNIALSTGEYVIDLLGNENNGEVEIVHTLMNTIRSRIENFIDGPNQSPALNPASNTGSMDNNPGETDGENQDDDDDDFESSEMLELEDTMPPLVVASATTHGPTLSAHRRNAVTSISVETWGPNSDTTSSPSRSERTGASRANSPPPALVDDVDGDEEVPVPPRGRYFVSQPSEIKSEKKIKMPLEKYYVPPLDVNPSKQPMPSSKRPSKPYGNLLSMRQDIPYGAWSNDGWILPGDFDDSLNLSDDDIMTKTVIVQTMVDTVSLILNEDMIDKSELDGNFKQYLTHAPNGIHHVIGMMLENSYWVFDPNKKFLWIYLMTACYYEPRALKYLISNQNFSPDLLTKKDMFGASCVLNVCKSRNSTGFVELFQKGLLTNEVLMDVHRNGLTPFMTLFANWSIFQKALEHLPDFKDQFNTPSQVPNASMSSATNVLYPFHIACCESEEVARYMLDNKTVTKKVFQSLFDGFTCCMMGTLFNPELVPTLFDHEFCTSELINHEHRSYGNVVMMAAMNNRPMLTYMLASGRLSKDSLKSKYKYTNTISTNILFELTDSHDSFVEIFDSDLVDVNDPLITFVSNDESLFNRLARTNSKCLKHVLNSDKVSKEMVMKTSKKSCLMTAIEHLNTGAIEVILESKVFCPEMVVQQDASDRNIVMIMLQLMTIGQLPLNIVAKVYSFMTEELVLQRNKFGLNTLAYIAIYDTPKFIELMDSELLAANGHKVLNMALSQVHVDKVTMLCAICCMTKDVTSIAKLLASEAVTTEMLSKRFMYGSNLLFELCEHNRDLIVDVINSDKCTPELFNRTNSKGDNLLIKYISCVPFIDEISEVILDSILSSKHITKDHINTINKKGDTALILAALKSEKFLKKLLDSKYFDLELFNRENKDGVNCFMMACQSGNLSIIKTIGEHSSFNQNMYTVKCLLYALQSVETVRTYVINHKFNNNEILKEAVAEWMMQHELNNEIVQSIVTCNYMSKEVLLIRNKHGINMLAFAMAEDFELAKTIIASEHCSYELFALKDDKDRNIMNFVAGYEGLTQLIVDSPHFKTDLLLTVNKNGNSPLEKMLIDSLIADATYIIKSDKCNLDVLKFKANGTNLIASMSSYGLEDVILELPYVTPDDLLVADDHGRTCLHNAVSVVDTDGHYSSILKILSSDKCSSKLVEMTDENDDTFVMLNYEILTDLLTSKHCTREMLYKTNNKGLSILTLACVHAPELVGLILSDPRVDGTILTSGSGVINPIGLAMTLANTSLDSILESEKCTDDIINAISDIGLTPLLLGIYKNQHENVKKLIDSKFDLSASFDHKDKDGRTLLMFATGYGSAVFRILFESKYMNQQRLLAGDMYRHNTMIYALFSSLEITRMIVESDYWTPEVQMYRDIDDDFLLLYPYRNPEIVEYLMTSGKCTVEMVAMTNKVGMNCSHYYVRNATEALTHLLESDICTEDVIKKQDYLGNTCLHYACKENPDAAMKIINCKHFRPANMLIQNRSKQNPFMIALEHNKQLAKSMYDMGLVTKEVMMQMDKDDNTSLNYAIRYSETIGRKLIKSEYFKDLIGHRNLDNYTPVMIASKYNGKLTKDIFDTGLCTNEMLYSVHTDYGSCLTIAAEFQPIAVKYILAWKNLDWRIIRSYDNHRDFVQIACQTNPKSVKYIVESEMDLSSFFEGKNVITAAKYQPDALEHILGSKYGSPKLFDIYVDDQNCVDTAFCCQPMSLVKILKSKHSSHTIMNREDRTTGYRLLHKLNRVYENIESLDDILELELVKYKNEVCKEPGSKLLCQLCYEYEKFIVFQCGHSCCVGCGFNINTCHICRKKVKARSCIYD